MLIRAEEMKRILFALIFYLSLPPVVFAADHYIRSGASGTADGSDWTNAFTTKPTWVRGDTYYIADGTYGQFNFDTPVSGTTWIYLKKATAAAHGTETGWDEAYGDGVALFDPGNDWGWKIETSYWDIDGVVGGGSESWFVGHGFKISLTPTGTTGRAITLYNNNVTHVNLSHFEATQSNFADKTKGSGGYYTVATGTTDVNISNAWIHGFNGCTIATGAPVSAYTIDNCAIGDNWGDQGSIGHSEIWSMLSVNNSTIKNSYLYSWRSTGGLIAINGEADGTGPGNINDTVQIYNNIFDQGDGQANCVICVIHDGSNDQYAKNWSVFNNTFVNVDSSSTGVSAVAIAYLESDNTTNLVKNNIWYGHSDTLSFSGNVHNYNWFTGASVYTEANGYSGGVEDPFTNSATADYTLKSGATPIARGTATGQLSAADIAGVSWATPPSMGAYELDVPDGSYTVTPSVASESGTISPNAVEVVASGGNSTTYTATPAHCYSISAWSGTCGATGSAETYQKTNVTEDCTIIVTFAFSCGTATVGAGGSMTLGSGGSITF